MQINKKNKKVIVVVISLVALISIIYSLIIVQNYQDYFTGFYVGLTLVFSCAWILYVIKKLREK